mmetsp:Transcript_39937/g.62302  ORF Transcript_39937/g.62302 Transcript_39937/m.62302 type:complete len:148 (-) Transcript_39937:120-563(-)
MGKHGDTALGEIDVINSLLKGEADAGFVSELMWSRAINAGEVNSGDGEELVILPNGPAPFDHCQFDALPTLPKDAREAFSKALFAMSWDNSDHRKVMQMEGLRKEWRQPREQGYNAMREAIKGEPNEAFPRPLHEENRHPFKTLTFS